MEKLESNLVDERYELAALIFRLAGNVEYNDAKTRYQRGLNAKFAHMKSHSAVIYARELRFGYDAVFFIAIHLQKAGEVFSLIEDIDCLVNLTHTGWTKENAAEFLAHLNSFYADSKFAEFFLENAKFYLRRSKAFQKYAFKFINFDWLGRHGLNRARLRFIISPSNKNHAYGGYVLEKGCKISYSCVPALFGPANFFIVETVIHEFMHSIANPIAEVLYAENEQFRRWCDSSVDKEKLAVYATGPTMAYEYVTRAYSIWYFAETGGQKLAGQFRAEVNRGFPYIEQVYALLQVA